jgi:branched-chain amino acid aminotransferase
MVTGTAFIDGKYMPVGEAKISILDFGVIHADATYDVAHVINRRIYRPDWHLDRFFNSAKGLRLEIPHTKEEILEISKNCLKKSGFNDAFIWMGCTRGIPESGSPRDLASCKNKFFMYVKQYYGMLMNEVNTETDGMRLMISDIVRIPKEAINPKFKNFHWGDLTKSQFVALDNKVDSALTVDLNGNIEEGPGFNIFMVKGGVVRTPKEGMLEGITRRSTLEICKEEGIKTELTVITPKELFNDSDEVFITSTAGGITWVKSLYLNGEEKTFEYGPTTKKLSDIYWQKHSDPDWSMSID